MFLDKVTLATLRRMERRKAEIPPERLRETCVQLSLPPSFREAVRRRPVDGIRIIAEIKRASPSRGPIRPDLSVEKLAESYQRGGACAVSVLTEPEFFKGSLEDLERARAATSLPLLRKDFILDPYQLLEARAYGASAALLIAALLPGDGLAALLAEAETLGLESLVEVRGEAELEAALAAGAGVIGINNRDLRTLEVELETTARLAPLVPPDRTLVSESGYGGRAQLAGLAALGVDAVLVGEALVREEDPASALRKMAGGGHVAA
ncbi:MAG: indole-3-glycerol phosphate synthase TrpC [Actinomycetota bacterium]|nr:indole-3-glycerol phosphate synthase TrpC [Actinomycetota bacterium]MDD5666246.1 indole-3-glycerol phosphate synthase TrpC [Actinomycetota bacterium]